MCVGGGGGGGNMPQKEAITWELLTHSEAGSFYGSIKNLLPFQK